MSLSTAKHHAHLARYSVQSETETVEHLKKAVYDLCSAVEDLKREVQRLKH
jgi:hypothetical protein